MDPAVEAYVRLAVYVSTAVVLLRVIHLLVLVPVAEESELSEARVRVLTAVAQVALAVFALTSGFQFAADALHVDALHQTAEGFAREHLHRIATASVQAAVVKSVSAVSGTIPVLGFLPGAVSQALTHVLDRLYHAGEAAAVVLTLLVFGRDYAMSTLFPLGVVVLLIPGARYAGGFLVAAAVTLWLVLPAVLVGVVMPVAGVAGMDAEPPLGFFTTVFPLLFPQKTAALPPAVPVLIELWREFIDWYVKEVLLWLYVVPAVTGMVAVLLMVGIVSVVGSGRVIYLLRRVVRYMLPLRGIR